MAPNRRALQIVEGLTNIDARFMKRGREKLMTLEEGVGVFIPDLDKALVAVVVSTRHEDQICSFFARAEGDWNDLLTKPISSLTVALLASCFRQAACNFLEADFVVDCASETVQGEMISNFVVLTRRLQEALSGGIFDVPDCNLNRHISVLWMSLAALVWSLPWILEHISCDALVLLENKTLERGFLQEDDPAMSARNFATFVRAKGSLKRFFFSSKSHERVVKGFLLREIESFQPIDLCQSISGLSICLDYETDDYTSDTTSILSDRSVYE